MTKTYDANENIIRKIKGLLNKSEGNDDEAQSALVLAQRLMLKYKIDEEQVQGADLIANSIDEEKVTVYKSLHYWEDQLASVIANNFRVKMYYQNKGSYKSIRYYGFDKDRVLAKEVFIIAYEALLAHSKKYLNRWYEKNFYVERTRKTSNYLLESYRVGFVEGLSEAFDKQVSALKGKYEVMVLIPKEVKDSYKQMSDSWGTKPYSKKPIYKDYQEDALASGVQDGSNMDFTRKHIAAERAFSY
ncbi:MAG: DUF2786 domain-containing protein [Oenococcus sp.]|uniref:DUF2786 domain-containing protein n=1 Tax=Oenococcus sp. TaxID=1979414 RepID=UPI0039E7AE1C